MDIKRPLTLFTTAAESISASMEGPYEDCYNTFRSIIGDGVDAVYALPNMRYKDIDETRKKIMKTWLPAYDLAYPNIYNFFNSNPVNVRNSLAIEIPSLKRLIIAEYNRGSALSYQQYVISPSGGLTKLGTPASALFNKIAEIAYQILTLSVTVITNYTSDDSILTSDVYDLSFDVWQTDTGRVISYIRNKPTTEKEFINNLFLETTKPDFNLIPPDNPYEPGGPSGPGDLPPGTFDDDSDPIPDSSLPTISSANTGFTRIYNPTLSQVQALASYLWTTPDVIETIWNHIKQFFENPMEAMIGFNLVPVPVPNGGTTNFKLMYIDTGVQMTAAASQFVDRDCGTLKIERYYGSALDQSPYTKISCFLPYIGTVQLNTDEVMGTTLQVKYRVDICSGSCVAKIFVDGSCLYQYSGHCAIPIPFSAADFSSYVSAAVSVAKLAIGAATAGAAGVAAGAIPTAAQQTNQVITQATVSAPGSNLPALIPTRSQITDTPSDQSSTEASFSGISPSSISNTVGEIMTSKPHVEHSGSFSGNTGYLGIRRPYVIIERPNMCMPAQYQHFNGFPAMISMELGTCKGYTRIQQVQLTGMTATNPEQAEILELLKSGVVF